MKLSRISPLTGRYNTMDLPLTPDTYDAGVAAWRAGLLIQLAFPTLSPDLREFVKTGITPEEWAAAFPTEDAAPGETVTFGKVTT